jgi:hypothetical protein
MYDIGITHSYVIEGIDKGSHGFLVPPENIEQAGMELMPAVAHLASIVSKKRSKDKTLSWF